MLNKAVSAFKSQRLIIALGIFSASIIAFQLILMQLISFMQWYHFAYMIISIAMLGFGAAGTALALYRMQLLRASSWLVPLLMSTSGMFMLISFYLARLPFFQFDVYVLFVERKQFLILAANYLIFFIPFLLGALAIGVLLTKHSDEIGKYYFSNLLGSGAGGGIVVIILNRFFAIDALPLAAIIALSAAVICFERQQMKKLQLSALVAGLVLVIIGFVNPGQMPMSQYKALSRTMLLPEAEIILSKPDIHGRIDVVQSPALRYAPSLSFGFIGDVPVKKNVFSNGEFYGVVPRFMPNETNIHTYTTENLAYITGKRNNVLLPDAATGPAIAHALYNGAQNVHAIIEVKAVKELMKNELAENSSLLFHDDRVQVFFQDSRQFLFAQKGIVYDAIILPRMESFGGSTGLNAITENYTLTVEAFEQMWDKLSDNGVISITSWMDYPPRTTYKIAATLVHTLRNKGIDNPVDHLAAIRSWGTITFMISRQPMQDETIEKIREFCSRMLFDPVLLPGIKAEEREVYNFLEFDDFFNHLDEIVNVEHPEIFDRYPFFIEPATDDKPYFNRFFKPLRFKEIAEKVGSDDLPFLELGYLIVWITLIQGALLAIVLIILPLLRLKSLSKGKIYTIIYFGCLGLGYMFVEIIFIQRFILFFGHPLYAVSAVISTMMVASGAGSLLSGRIKNSVWLARSSTLLITLLILVYSLLMTPLLISTINLPVFMKVVFAFILISLPAFFMGMPFPGGIRLLDQGRKDQIPWAWGINGCMSVIATALATLISVEAGFRVVMVFALLFYFVAFLVARLLASR